MRKEEDSYTDTGSDKSHVNVSFVEKGQNHKRSVYDKPHPFEEKGGPKLNRTEVLLLIQLAALNAFLLASPELRLPGSV